MTDDKDTLIGDAAPKRSGPHAPLPTPPPKAAAPPQAEQDSRSRAAQRAAELHEHLGAGLDEDGVDEFYIDPRIIPDGWSYEYKRYTVYGAQDPSYQVALAMKGWQAVPASRHPELMPDNHKGATIERKGMVLMERPAVITAEANARELRKATGQLRNQEDRLNGAAPGQFEKKVEKLNRSYGYEPIPIPK